MKHTHSDRLERWLGAEQVAGLSRAMRDFYWPVAVHGVPGSVHAMPGGDFTGEIRGGQEMTAVDHAISTLRRVRRNRFARAAMSRKQLGAFTNLSALIAAATGGKAQNLTFAKTGVASNAIGNCIDLWTALTSQPSAGAAGAAAPTGTSPTNSTAGALPFANPANANTGHFVSGYVTASVVANTLLLYDRLFSVAKTMNSTGTEAVTGTFSRYQSGTATAADYIGGNFCFPSVPTTVLPATAHNWTVCQYCVDEASQCLTRRKGWTSIDSLRDDDEILAFDPETKTTRWERLRGVFVNRKFKGDMISMGEREFNAFTTPDHRWPVLQKYDGSIVVQRTESLTDIGWLMRHAPHEAPKEATHSDEFVRLAAWYFTEGSRHGEHSIRIAQSQKVNPEFVAAIRSDINRIGARRKTHKQQGFLSFGQPRGTRCDGLYISEHATADGMVCFTLSGTDIDSFRKAITGDDKVPSMEFLLSLTAHQAKEFVRVCLCGDGTPERQLFYQHHGARMDAYMIAAVLAGYGPNLHDSAGHKHAACSLREAHTISAKVPQARMYYEGTIWCPITESGHWVMRRNGKTCITGNTDQGSNTGQSFPSIAGVSACVLRGVDLAPGYWFMPLAAGDVGVKALTQMQCSALVATGTVDFVVGHPIAFFPCPVANMVCVVDGINTAFSLTQVYDNACLAFLEMPKPATTAASYSGLITVVAE